MLLLALGTAVLATHWPALSTQALSFDDTEYLTENRLVQNPSWTSARRFLSEVLEPSTTGGAYQPLSMISLMLDYAAGGRPDNLRAFHRTSLVLHVLNTALVALLLYLLFGNPWIAVAAALLFGLHPLTVGRITWVTDRKTVLAAFFSLWCLVHYLCYVRHGIRVHYAVALLLYVLAMMSKPTSLPLPVLFLLLDYWPLRRLSKRTALLTMPFFVVGGIGLIISFVSFHHTLQVVMPGHHGMPRILFIVCHNIVFYLCKVVWPVHLSTHCPFPEPFSLEHPAVLTGVIGTCVLVSIVLASWRRTRAPLIGWAVFFVAVFPTLGVIGFTPVIAANRFVYFPIVGILIILAAFLEWVCVRWGGGRRRARDVIVAAIILLVAGTEAVLSRQYAARWNDTVSLCEYMLKLTPEEEAVHNHLGVALRARGKTEEGIEHFRLAIEYDPESPRAHYNLGNALKDKRMLDEAITQFREALQRDPRHVLAHNNLGVALAMKGELDEAIRQYLQAVDLEPEHVPALINLGRAYVLKGDNEKAIAYWDRAVRLNPRDKRTRMQLLTLRRRLLEKHD